MIDFVIPNIADFTSRHMCMTISVFSHIFGLN